MDIGALQLTLRRYAAELLQFAEQTSIGLHDGPGAKTHVLVDWENVQPDEVECRALVAEATDVWLFHGPNQKNVARKYAAFGDRVQEVPIARTGKNSLDFHLSFYVGYLAAKQPDARVVVLSNDKGFGPMLDHARQLGFEVSQLGVGRGRGARKASKAPARKSAAKQAPARKKAAAAPAGKTPAKKTRARKSAAKTTAAPKTVARKTAAQKTTAPKAVAARTPPATAAKTPSATKKSFEQVRAMLEKSPSRPRKHKSLLAFLTSRAGAGSEAEARALVERLVDEGAVTVDAQRNVGYRL